MTGASDFLIPFFSTTLSRESTWWSLAAQLRYDQTVGDFANTNITDGIPSLGRVEADAEELQTVADLRCTGVGARVAVVAVAVDGGLARCHLAIEFGAGRAGAKTVGIGVAVEYHTIHRKIVGSTGAVVVQGIADFQSARIDLGVQIVAIGAGFSSLHPIGVLIVVVAAVTGLIDAVIPDLGCTRVDIRIAVVAVLSGGRSIPIPIGDPSVAVVGYDAVRLLLRRGAG